MLSVNPKMLPRLDELETDLITRRERAVDEGWHGEIEGIDLTLTFLRSKRVQAQARRCSGHGQPRHASHPVQIDPERSRKEPHEAPGHANLPTARCDRPTDR